MNLTEKQIEALGWLADQTGQPYDHNDDGGYSRQLSVLVDKGLAQWNAISTQTYGGYLLTKKGAKIAIEVCEIGDEEKLRNYFF
jgi:hypothetical protein